MTSGSSRKVAEAPAGPPPVPRLCHAALLVHRFEAVERFYTDALGMEVAWRPDPDTVYLTSGSDSLALRRSADRTAERGGRLDHIGLAVARLADVDHWHDILVARGTPVVAPPRTHRDGARSFYCRDPEGTLVQILYHPALSKKGENGA